MIQDTVTTALKTYYAAQTLSKPVEWRAQKDHQESQDLMGVFRVESEAATHEKLLTLTVEWEIFYSPDTLLPVDYITLLDEVSALSPGAWAAVDQSLIAIGAQGLGEYILQNLEGDAPSERGRSSVWSWEVRVVLASSHVGCP